MSAFDFDLFVIGGGSGGVRAARVAAGHGAKVAIAEQDRFGGTCVIRGCVPKKLLVYASRFADEFEDAAGFGWSVGEPAFDWASLIANKDREIARLEGIYKTLLAASGVTVFPTRAVLADAHAIRLGAEARTVTADKVLIATGSRPFLGEAIPGIEHVISSDEAFHLKELPRAHRHQRRRLHRGGVRRNFRGPRRGGDDPLPRRQDPARVRRGPARRADRGLPAAWDPVRHGAAHVPHRAHRARASRAVSTTAACSRPIRSCTPRAARRTPPTSGSRRSA